MQALSKYYGWLVVVGSSVTARKIQICGKKAIPPGEEAKKAEKAAANSNFVTAINWAAKPPES